MALPGNVVDVLIEKVKNNLGRTNDSTVTDYTIQWINEAQREVCNRANFWFMQATTTIAFTQSDTSASLPSDFKDEDAFWIVESSPDGFTEMFPMSIEDERRQHDDTTEAKPGEYRVSGTDTLIIRPVPDASYTVQCDYWKYLTDLTDPGGSSNDLVDNYSGILEAGATYRGLRRLGEFEDASAWQGIFENDIRNLVVTNAERVLPNEFVLSHRPDALGTTTRRIKGRLR